MSKVEEAEAIVRQLKAFRDEDHDVRTSWVVECLQAVENRTRQQDIEAQCEACRGDNLTVQKNARYVNGPDIDWFHDPIQEDGGGCGCEAAPIRDLMRREEAEKLRCTDSHVDEQVSGNSLSDGLSPILKEPR